jgi:hypothetical protein
MPLEILIVPRPIKKLPAFYGSRGFVTQYPPLYSFLSQLNPSLAPFFEVNFNTVFPYTVISRK